MTSIFDQVEANIDNLVENQVCWSQCATPEQMDAARNGELDLHLGISKSIPKDWIADISGKKVLCLAGAGGLQAPLLACAGAEVTVIDISQKMLDLDRRMAQQYGLDIRIVHGNMQDLSRFPDDSFDYIVNPISLCYVPSVHPVFRECYRVLKKGGALILAATNPIAYVCDYIEDENGGYYKAVNHMPYKSTDHPDQGGWVEFGHTMEDFIGGQLACGFVLTGYMEDQQEDITELIFMTKAVKQ